ncbi:YfaZ family outer membrane protein [Thalassotalea sp. PLHSN55]|uniref:YfaZ family outer membrane protein n=1 Tax=Thalassotalea sp. PLHSN55 TaxID=3435888 RepID=UPI003F8758F7
MNKLTLAAIVCAASMGVITNAQADALDLALSDKTAHISYENINGATNKSMIKTSYFHRENGGDAFDMSLLVGDVSEKSKFLIGGKMFYLNLDNDQGSDGYGLALGAEGEFTLSSRVYLKGHIYYSPEVTTFNDIENYRDFEVRIGYDVIPEASISLGYRYAKAKLEYGGSQYMQDNLFVALTMRF